MELFSKSCKKCHQYLPFEEFHADQRTADKLQPWCKSCHKEWRKDRSAQEVEEYRQRCRKHEAQYRETRIATCMDCGKEYLGRRCKPCAAIRNRKWQDENRERNKIKRARDYQRWKTDPEYRDAHYQRHLKYYARLKSEVFAHYGGKCFCCGLSDPRFLTIDHANNDGTKYRHPGGKRIAGTAQMKLIKAMGYPADIRLACWNCNCARQYNKGVCPHEIDRQRSEV